MLVGVIEAQIQRGSLVQEPFYWALTSILRQAYEHMATVGKMIYHDNPRRLAMIVGDEGFTTINITKDNLLQDYRIFIKRSESKEQGIVNGNSLLFTLLQAQLIDQKIFANLFNRATPELIASELRQYHKDIAQAQNNQARAQMDQSANMRTQQAEMNDEMEAAEQGEEQKQVDMMQLQHANKMDEVSLKEGAKLQREVLKNQGM
jgi:hypothetical protein